MASQIIISNHAKKRLSERVPQIHRNNWNSFVRSARYNGFTDNNIAQIDENFFNFLKKRYHANHSTQLRIYKNYVFVFSGNDHHCRTLVTVVNIPEEFLNKINSLTNHNCVA